jgi:hypothetical protein
LVRINVVWFFEILLITSDFWVIEMVWGVTKGVSGWVGVSHCGGLAKFYIKKKVIS